MYLIKFKEKIFSKIKGNFYIISIFEILISVKFIIKNKM